MSASSIYDIVVQQTRAHHVFHVRQHHKGAKGGSVSLYAGDAMPAGCRGLMETYDKAMPRLYKVLLGASARHEDVVRMCRLISAIAERHLDCLDMNSKHHESGGDTIGDGGALGKRKKTANSNRKVRNRLLRHRRDGRRAHRSCSWVPTFMFGTPSKAHKPLQLLFQALAEPSRISVVGEILRAIRQIISVLNESNANCVSNIVRHIASLLFSENQRRAEMSSWSSARHLECFGELFAPSTDSENTNVDNTGSPSSSSSSSSSATASSEMSFITVVFASQDCVDHFLVSLTRLAHLLLPPHFHHLSSSNSCSSLWEALLHQLTFPQRQQKQQNLPTRLRSVTMETLFTMLMLTGPASHDLPMLGVPRHLSLCLELYDDPGDRGERFDEILARAIRLVCREFHDGSGGAEGETIVASSQGLVTTSGFGSGGIGSGINFGGHFDRSMGTLRGSYSGLGGMTDAQRLAGHLDMLSFSRSGVQGVPPIVSFLMSSGLFDSTTLIRNVRASRSPELSLELCVCYLVARRLCPEMRNLDVAFALLEANTVSFCTALLLDVHSDSVSIIQEIAHAWRHAKTEVSAGKNSGANLSRKRSKRRSSSSSSGTGGSSSANLNLETSPGNIGRGNSKRRKAAASSSSSSSSATTTSSRGGGSSSSSSSSSSSGGENNRRRLQYPGVGLTPQYRANGRTPFASTPSERVLAFSPIQHRLHSFVAKLKASLGQEVDLKDKTSQQPVEDAVALVLLLLRTDNFDSQTDLHPSTRGGRLDEDGDGNDNDALVNVDSRRQLVGNLLEQALKILQLRHNSTNNNTKDEDDGSADGLRSEAYLSQKSRVVPFHAQVLRMVLETCSQGIGNGKESGYDHSFRLRSRAIFEECLCRGPASARVTAVELLPELLAILEQQQHQSVNESARFTEMTKTFCNNLCEVLTEFSVAPGTSLAERSQLHIAVANAMSTISTRAQAFAPPDPFDGVNLRNSSFELFNPAWKFLVEHHAQITDRPSANALASAVADVIRAVPSVQLKMAECKKLVLGFISLLRSPNRTIREAVAAQAELFAVDSCRVVTCIYEAPLLPASSKTMAAATDGRYALQQFTDHLNGMIEEDDDEDEDRKHLDVGTGKRTGCKRDDSLRAILTAVGSIGCALPIPNSQMLPRAGKAVVLRAEKTSVANGKSMMRKRHKKRKDTSSDASFAVDLYEEPVQLTSSSDSDINSGNADSVNVHIKDDGKKSIIQTNEWLLLEWVVGLLIDTWADHSLSRAVRTTARVQCTRVAGSKSLSAGELLLRMGSSDSGVITNVVRILLSHSNLQPSLAVDEFHKYFCISSSSSSGPSSSRSSGKVSFFEKTIEHTLPYLVCNQEDDLLQKYAGVLGDLGRRRKKSGDGSDDAVVVEASVVSQPSMSGHSVSDDVRKLIHTQHQFIIPRILMLRDNEKRLVAIKFMLTRLSRKKPIFDDIISKSFLKVLKHLCWLVAESDESLSGGGGGDALGALRRLAYIVIPKRYPTEVPEDASDGKAEVSFKLMISHYFLHVVGYLQTRIAIGRRERNMDTKRRGVVCMHRLLRLVSETHKDAASFRLTSRERKKSRSEKNKLSHYYGGANGSAVKGKSAEGDDDGENDPFLPFVSTILVNLSSATADNDTCDLAVYMWHDFVHMLSPTTLGRCLYPMVVSLFQVLRKNDSGRRVEGYLSAEMGVNDVQGTAVDALRYVIVDRHAALQGELCTLPLHAKEMQIVGAMAPEIVQIISDKIAAVSRDDLIRKLISRVVDGQSSNLAIGVAVLRELKFHLIEYLKNDPLSDAMVGAGDARILIVKMVGMLLNVARVATDMETKLLCAECLGQLGALDPSRILSGTDKSHSNPIQRLAQDRPSPAKDSEALAVHLIGNFLVQSFRAAGDPALQNCCAAAIQHGLQYIHELILAAAAKRSSRRRRSSGSGSTAASTSKSTGGVQKGELPHRVASQFTPTVVEVIRPFWTTNLQLPARQKQASPPFFRSHNLFETWVCAWAKHMMQQAMGPHTKVFRTCLPAIRPVSAGSITDTHQIARYLLPYLIRDMLCYAKTDEERKERQREVLDELLLVLLGPQSGGGGSNGASSGSTASRPQTSFQLISVQAVFSLLDELNEWIAKSTSLQDSGGSSGSKSSKRNKSKSTGKKSKSAPQEKSIGHGEGGVLTEAEEASICAAVLAQISDRALADAAFRVKAYARAAMYLERDMRACHDPKSRGVARGSNCYGKERLYQIPFYRQEVEYLRRIFAHIDEPDTMQGLMYLRGLVQKQEGGAFSSSRKSSNGRKKGHGQSYAAKERAKKTRPTELSNGAAEETYGRLSVGKRNDLQELREAIIDHEHASEWDEALTCYEQLLNHHQQILWGNGGEGATRIHGGGVGADATNSAAQRNTASMMPPPDPRSPQMQEHPEPLSHRLDHEADLNYESHLHDIYFGIMRNLANSGHHETLLHHAIGALQHSDTSLSETVIPFAMEASWRLGRWDLLENLTEKELEHRRYSQGQPFSTGGGIEETQRSFMVNVSEALLSLRIEDGRRFETALSTARADVMGALSAASMESYEQAYPLVLKLHVLHEIEESQRMQMLPSSAEKRAFRKDCRWDERLAATRPSVRDHEFLLAVRRAIYRIQDETGADTSMPSVMPAAAAAVAFEMADASPRASGGDAGRLHSTFHAEEANGWIHLAQICTASGDQRMASSAVTHAMLLDDGNALVEKAKFYRAKNDLHRALILLDAGMPNMEDGGGGAGRLSSNASAHRSSTSSTSSSEAALVANARKKLVAQRIMLAADWTFESGLSAGDDVISRYQRATRLCPKWEDGYFSLGRYYDRLLQGQEDRLDKEGRDIFSPKSIPDGASSKQIKEVIVSAERDSHTAALIFDHAVQVVDNYGRAMRYGHRNVHVTLPRLLTVWFDYTSKLNDMVENEKHHHQDKRTKRSQRHCDPASYLSRLNGLLKTLAEDIPAYQWYMALPQLVSHMGLQSNVKCSQILNGIVSKVLAKYPRHVAWTVMGVANMESTVVGKKRAAAFVETMRYVIETQAVPAGIVLQTGSRLFYDLIKLAKLKTGRDHYVHHPIGNRRELDKARLLVPKQSFLIARLPGPDEPAIRDEDWEAFDGEGSGLVTIVKFEDDVQVISSAVCPKKLVCCGSNGRKYNLLCKFEKKGDFRKDSRMMKLFTLVNRFLQSDPEGRRRNLRMRTYNVTCLDEKSGLLEWVDNTMPVQYVIDGIYKKHPGTPPAKLTNRLYEQIQQLARSYPSDPIATIQSYRHQIVSHFPTLLHEWFDRTFSVPAEWFEARLSFSRSVAVWSMVGHIVGLGDRHSQNILMDLGTGECVHVDFDCIFDKGLMLRTPERAPFRLTRNIVDGMGVTGYEGVFRHCCECTMGILRSQQNQDMLINNLEAFVQDPLVTWFKTGVVGATSSSRSNNNNHNSRGQQHQSTQDNRIDPLLNATHSATHVLSTIRQRLSGVYNYSIENVLARNPEKRAYLQKKIASTMREAGVREAQAVIDNIPLSVQGQVQRLIKEATSEDNLIQMYPGWMPFL